MAPAFPVSLQNLLHCLVVALSRCSGLSVFRWPVSFPMHGQSLTFISSSISLLLFIFTLHLSFLMPRGSPLSPFLSSSISLDYLSVYFLPLFPSGRLSCWWAGQKRITPARPLGSAGGEGSHGDEGTATADDDWQMEAAEGLLELVEQFRTRHPWIV